MNYCSSQCICRDCPYHCSKKYTLCKSCERDSKSLPVYECRNPKYEYLREREYDA